MNTESICCPFVVFLELKHGVLYTYNKFVVNVMSYT